MNFLQGFPAFLHRSVSFNQVSCILPAVLCNPQGEDDGFCFAWCKVDFHLERCNGVGEPAGFPRQLGKRHGVGLVIVLI